MSDYIMEKLLEYKDEQYASFQARLTPSVDKNLFIGVRVPNVRLIAKQIKNSKEANEFLNQLPHKTYDENMLHGLLIAEIKDYDKCIEYIDKFLPYIDNWAVCDIMSPKVLKKHKEELLAKIKEWVKSNHTYTIRFAIEMLMSFYLDDDFKKEYLDIVCPIKSDEYYVNMMIAWFFATALSKQYEATLPILVEGRLGDWTHNKTIQKAIESYRITNEQKEYLRTLKR